MAEVSNELNIYNIHPYDGLKSKSVFDNDFRCTCDQEIAKFWVRSSYSFKYFAELIAREHESDRTKMASWLNTKLKEFLLIKKNILSFQDKINDWVQWREKYVPSYEEWSEILQASIVKEREHWNMLEDPEQRETEAGVAKSLSVFFDNNSYQSNAVFEEWKGDNVDWKYESLLDPIIIEDSDFSDTRIPIFRNIHGEQVLTEADKECMEVGAEEAVNIDHVVSDNPVFRVVQMGLEKYLTNPLYYRLTGQRSVYLNGSLDKYAYSVSKELRDQISNLSELEWFVLDAIVTRETTYSSNHLQQLRGLLDLDFSSTMPITFRYLFVYIQPENRKLALKLYKAISQLSDNYWERRFDLLFNFINKNNLH